MKEPPKYKKSSSRALSSNKTKIKTCRKAPHGAFFILGSTKIKMSQSIKKIGQSKSKIVSINFKIVYTK